MSVSPVKALVNMTMVPILFGIGYVDGVYWTLFLELQFYFLVFALLLFGFQERLNTVFLLWPFMMLGALFSGIGNWPFLGGYYSFFAAGAILAISKDKLSFRTGIPLLIAYALCVNFAVEQALQFSDDKGAALSGLVVGFIISLFFGFFFVLNSKRGSQLQLPKSKLVGALTYPIYLIHAHFGYMFISRFATEQNKLLIYIATFVIVLSVAYFMHTVIEIRFDAVWKSLFQNLVGKPVDKIQRRLSRLKDNIEEQAKGA